VKHHVLVAVLGFGFCSTIDVLAQTTGSGDLALPSLMPRDREIALARSAAPSAVSAEARVLILRRGGYVVADSGRNGVTCYVGRSWSQAIEPHCYDEEGSRTILPMALRRAELKEQGRSHEEIEADLAAGLQSGRFQLPTRPAMSYMMSSAQSLISDDGTPVGQWKPHLMVYYPYLTAAALGLGEVPSLDAAVVVDPGRPTANILIVVADFVDPVFESKEH